MFRLVVLVGCLVTATAAAQGSPTPRSADSALRGESKTTVPTTPSVSGSADIQAGTGTPAAEPPPSSSISSAAPAPEEETPGPAPEPPPGGLYGTPLTPRGVGPNLLPAPEDALKPAQKDLESDPLFLPSVLLIGGGSAVLLASLFTGLGAHSTYKQLDRDCSDNICPAGSQQKIDNGQTLAIVSTILTGVGIVAAGTGAGLLIVAANRTASENEPEPAQLSLRLTSGPTPLGLGASASF